MPPKQDGIYCVTVFDKQRTRHHNIKINYFIFPRKYKNDVDLSTDLIEFLELTSIKRIIII